MSCPNCGAPDERVIPVWEDNNRYEQDEQPKFLGCKSCHRMMRNELLPDDGDVTPPQASLTEFEKSRLESKRALGNQNDDRLTIVEWQCVKGAARYYGVTDWLAKIDTTLTKDENVGLMKRHGTENNETPLREMEHPKEYSGEIHE